MKTGDLLLHPALSFGRVNWRTEKQTTIRNIASVRRDTRKHKHCINRVAKSRSNIVAFMASNNYKLTFIYHNEWRINWLTEVLSINCVVDLIELVI